MRPFLLVFALLISANGFPDRPRPKHIVVPGYPRLARSARVEGSVKVEIKIDDQGHVIAATPSGGHKLLQSATVDNVQRWTFEAAEPSHEGPTGTSITYTYKLEGKANYDDTPPIVVLDLPDRILVIAHPPEPQP